MPRCFGAATWQLDWPTVAAMPISAADLTSRAEWLHRGICGKQWKQQTTAGQRELKAFLLHPVRATAGYVNFCWMPKNDFRHLLHKGRKNLNIATRGSSFQFLRAAAVVAAAPGIINHHT